MITALEGQFLQLDCTATGNPLPVVQWLFRRSTLIKSLNDSRVRDLMNGSMRINPLRPDHAGTYSCVLLDSSVRRDVELRVKRQGEGEGQKTSGSFHFSEFSTFTLQPTGLAVASQNKAVQ